MSKEAETTVAIRKKEDLTVAAFDILTNIIQPEFARFLGEILKEKKGENYWEDHVKKALCAKENNLGHFLNRKKLTNLDVTALCAIARYDEQTLYTKERHPKYGRLTNIKGNFYDLNELRNNIAHNTAKNYTDINEGTLDFLINFLRKIKANEKNIEKVNAYRRKIEELKLSSEPQKTKQTVSNNKEKTISPISTSAAPDKIWLNWPSQDYNGKYVGSAIKSDLERYFPGISISSRFANKGMAAKYPNAFWFTPKEKDLKKDYYYICKDGSTVKIFKVPKDTFKKEEFGKDLQVARKYDGDFDVFIENSEEYKEQFKGEVFFKDYLCAAINYKKIWIKS